MKTAAVIAELNPFHAGHEFFLREVRRRSGADHLAVIMSGDFVQRGEPAVFDKYSRTEMALACGADLVLELPAAASCGSAQRFAEGAVSILERLGVVDELWFGSEAGTIVPFLSAAGQLGAESGDFRTDLKNALSKGLSFPAARERALRKACLSDEEEVGGLLSRPNNILGLEYCLALRKYRSSIQPHTLSRTGSSYNSTEMPEKGYASAAAVRKCILDGQPPASYATFLPETLLPLYERILRESVPVCADDFSGMLLYQLQKEDAGSLSGYLDLSEDLANRIINMRGEFSSFSSFAGMLKTKNRTLTQVRRALLHVLLGIRPDDLDLVFRTPYVRVLGFSASGSSLLSRIQEKGQTAPVTKASALSSYPSDRDVFASRLYESVRSVKAGVPAVDEFRRPVLTR